MALAFRNRYELRTIQCIVQHGLLRTVVVKVAGALLDVPNIYCTCAAVAQLRWLGQVFSPTTSTTVPPPVAFYPLTDGGSDSVISYPDGVHIGTANFSVT